eukprot:jgi/Undpi1/11597/HiC_scaffold_30.g13892.m1
MDSGATDHFPLVEEQLQSTNSNSDFAVGPTEPISAEAEYTPSASKRSSIPSGFSTTRAVADDKQQLMHGKHTFREAQPSKGEGPMDNFMTKKLRKNQQEEQNRRYVAMCAVNFRPFSMINTPAFCWYLGGFSPAYMEKELHNTTLEGHLDSL